MIKAQEFETLMDVHGVNNCDLQALTEKSKEISTVWKDYIVDNSEELNFSMSNDMRFTFTAKTGEQRVDDISEFAFGQLCARLGIPASYVKKCFEYGKIDLALRNFQEWAGEMTKRILIREYDGVVHAVLSDSYSKYDSYSVMKTLNNTVDNKIYQPNQAFLSTDRLHLRYVNFNQLPIEDTSPLYAGFTVDSSDVGRGSLKMQFFLYRSVCTNGMVVSSLGGTLFHQNHMGSKISGGKLELFNRALCDIDRLSEQAVQLVKKSQGHYLRDYELQMYLKKAERELKLSEKSQDKLRLLIDSNYSRNLWGVMNGVTELAQDFTLDTRLQLESWAGELLTEAAA